MSSKKKFNGVTYYGGKKRLAKYIVSLFKEDYQKMNYVEPFFGGGAVFFEKQAPARYPLKEILNDLDNSIYKMFLGFQKGLGRVKNILIKLPHHETQYIECKRALKEDYDKLDLFTFSAYKYYILMSSFSSTGRGFAMSRFHALKKNTAIDLLNNDLTKKLKSVCFTNRDALDVIKLNSKNKNTLFYVDPPYPESTQDYTHKFNSTRFNLLLNELKKIKGSFILSCYKKNWMDFDKSWTIIEKKTRLLVRGGKNQDPRTECLVLNYKPKNKDVKL